MHPRRRGAGMGVMLLLYQILGVIGIKHIPPVTLSTIALNVAVYLRLFKLPWRKTSQVCVSVYKVFYRKEYMRLLYAAFEHVDDWHLYYNMLSFVFKGQALEKRFGGVKFLYIIAVFTVLTNSMLVALSMSLSEYESDFENHCAVGFSGVIFALKVLTSYYFPNYTHQIMGIPIIMPANYAVWLELILIQLLVPNVSFLGHLAGILVGLAYVKSPVGQIIDSVYSLVANFINPSHRFTSTARRAGHSNFNEYVVPDLTEEEQLNLAAEQNLQDNQAYSRSSNLYPDLEEIRHRRIEHYAF